MSKDFSNTILRWSVGMQNTVVLSDRDRQQMLDMLWLCKLSVISFQKFFPGAAFYILYNGMGFQEFIYQIEEVNPQFLYPVKFINQREEIKHTNNPYHFMPIGVWWKWIPFRLDINKHEIAIDTDIICVNEPLSWYEWIDGNTSILIAPERYEKVSSSTTGDFFSHPLLQGKKPYNCGVVGQKSGCNYEQRFFDITKTIEFGHTHDSMFITEQGAINLWIRSLELEGVRHSCLDFSLNAWVRDFVYFLEKGIKVETVHAVSWYKDVVKGLKDIFENKILGNKYIDNKSFLEDIISRSDNLDFYGKYVLSKQLGDSSKISKEILLF